MYTLCGWHITVGNGFIFHVTCHFPTMVSNASLVKRKCRAHTSAIPLEFTLNSVVTVSVKLLNELVSHVF